MQFWSLFWIFNSFDFNANSPLLFHRAVDIASDLQNIQTGPPSQQGLLTNQFRARKRQREEAMKQNKLKRESKYTHLPILLRSEGRESITVCKILQRNKVHRQMLLQRNRMEKNEKTRRSTQLHV